MHYQNSISVKREKGRGEQVAFYIITAENVEEGGEKKWMKCVQESLVQGRREEGQEDSMKINTSNPMLQGGGEKERGPRHCVKQAAHKRERGGLQVMAEEKKKEKGFERCKAGFVREGNHHPRLSTAERKKGVIPYHPCILLVGKGGR